MQRTQRKRGPYKRRFAKPLFDLPYKTTTPQGKRDYSRLYMQRTRLEAQPKRSKRA